MLLECHRLARAACADRISGSPLWHHCGTVKEEAALRKELGLGDLVLAQVLCVVGSSWVGVAAKLGRAHVVFWLAAMLAFYVPLAAVVIYLNRLMPLEGGLYQWAKQGFGEMAGFLIAWNLWVYAVVVWARSSSWCPRTWDTCSARGGRGWRPAAGRPSS